MKRIILLPLFLLFINTTIIDENIEFESNTKIVDASPAVSVDSKLMAFESYTESFYDCLNNSELNFNLFTKGLKGYYALKNDNKLANTQYLTLIDFTKASNEERCFIIDMESKTVAFQTIIAHGKNTGKLMAKKFSNEAESRMSSLGFYTTGVIYDGKYDYSLKLHGLEYSNNNAFDRGVVMHSADYATEEFLHTNGNVLGRSFGCPALPHLNYHTIVDQIKNGSCLFIYGKDREYSRKSKLMRTNEFIDAFYADYLEQYS
ncbi:MAG: murein L,D-transpeptidase catalytic domain family protein [Flavobacteriales bacterium]